jgi:hypothetical protein
MAQEGLVAIFNDKDLKTALKNIKCPLHHAVKPGCIGYEIEPNPMAKHFSDDMCKEFKVKNWRYKRDQFNQKILKFSEHYQPEVSALYLKERVYHHTNPICVKCRRCFQ